MTKININAPILDSPSQVIGQSVTFTVSGKTAQGGFGRIGRVPNGPFTVIVLDATIGGPSGSNTNSGYVN